MNVSYSRGAGDNPAPQEIVDELLTSEEIGVFRCIAELNANDSSRLMIDGDGPKGSVLIPTNLVEVNSRSEIKRGTINMYARTYQQENGKYTINSHITIETKV